MTNRAPDTSIRTRLSAAKPMLIRAGLLGLCLGMVIIGLLHNFNRFKDPEELMPNAQLEAIGVGQSGSVSSQRSDRLDFTG